MKLGSCLCLSSATQHTLEEIDGHLDTGDIIWMEGEGVPNFMVKCREWKTFTHVGFLIRTGDGPEGLQVCFPVRQSSGDASSEPLVRMRGFQDLMKDGYHQIGVSCVATGLKDAEKNLVMEFAKGSLGRDLNTRVTLLVTRGRRVFCNQLVVDMLVACGRALLFGECYGPTMSNRGNLLEPIVLLALPTRGSPLLNANADTAARPV